MKIPIFLDVSMDMGVNQQGYPFHMVSTTEYSSGPAEGYKRFVVHVDVPIWPELRAKALQMDAMQQLRLALETQS